MRQYEKNLLLLINALKENHYTQVATIKKINALGFPIKKANYNKLVNHEKHQGKPTAVSTVTVKAVIPKLEAIVKNELGLVFDEARENLTDIKDDRWRPQIIKTETPKLSQTLSNQPIWHLEGKRPLSEKLKLIQQSEYHYLEIGLLLEDFVFNLTQEGEAAFKIPLLEKLQEGLDVSYFVLNPNGRFHAPYLSSQSKVLYAERQTLERFKDKFNHLKDLIENLNNQTRKGKIQLSIYNTFPYFHAAVADAMENTAKMLVTPFLYGTRRADCPVIEMTKKHHRKAYSIYMNTIKNMIN